MAATNFSDGSFCTPDFLNTFYNSFTDANGNTWQGHQHDGVNMDGHASKINLATDTIGTFSVANLGWPSPYSGTGYSYLSGGDFSPSTNISVSISWQVTGNNVVIAIAGATGTSATDAMTLLAGDMTSISGYSSIPYLTTIPIVVYNNNVLSPGVLQFNGTGVNTFGCYCLSSESFTNGFLTSGTKGLANTTIQITL